MNDLAASGGEWAREKYSRKNSTGGRLAGTVGLALPAIHLFYLNKRPKTATGFTLFLHRKGAVLFLPRMSPEWVLPRSIPWCSIAVFQCGVSLQCGFQFLHLVPVFPGELGKFPP
ncbi:MAG: hypothetical protein V3S64_14865, partial [bacterium]